MHDYRDGCELRTRSHRVEEVPAIHPWHQEVEEYEAEESVGAIERVERLSTIARGDDRVAVAFQKVTHRVAKIVFVFDQQQGVDHRGDILFSLTGGWRF